MTDETTPTPGTAALLMAQVKDMVEDAIAAAVAPLHQQVADLQAQLAERVKYGDWVAVQSSGSPEQGKYGPFLSADQGGPDVGNTFQLTGQPQAGAWESWRVHRGAW